jgi:hypothetical protein
MIVTEIVEPIGAWALPPDDGTRPPGLHLSDIITDMCKRLDPKRYDTGEPMSEGKILTGLAVERLIEKTLRIVTPGGFRPHPIQIDGIWCSPDWITLGGQVEEFKCTWYSMAKPCPTHDVYWPWREQIKGYCYATGTLDAVLRAFFVNGDYKPPKPVWPPKAYQIQFTVGELKESWAGKVSHAERRGWL